MPVVDVAGVGTVEFPDSWSTDQISSKAKELQSSKGAFQKPKRPVREQAAENLQSMKSGAAKQQYEGAIKSADEDIATSRARVAKDAILTGAAALAAPLTAGTSLFAAAGIMAATGATASLAAEGVKKVMGSKEVAKNFGDLAWTLGFDAATFAGGEAFGRGVGAFVKGALPRMVMNSAAKVSAGSDALDTMARRTVYSLEGKIMTRGAEDVEIGNAMRRAEKQLADIPQEGRGELGRIADLTPESQSMEGQISRGLKARADTPKLEGKLRSATKKLDRAEAAVQGGRQSGYDAAVRAKARDEAAAVVADITQDLEKARGADSTKQPLDVLIRMKGKLQQFAYKHPDWREGDIFKDFADDLDQTIRGNLKGDEKSLYDHYNTITKAKFKASQSVRFANDFVMGLARRAVGGVVGGGIGYEAGGSKGAVAGAALGVATPHIAAYVLEQTVKTPRSKGMMAEALTKWINGQVKESSRLAERAFMSAGARQAIEQYTNTRPEDIH